MDRPLPPDQRERVGRPAVTWGIGDFVWVYFAGIAASLVFAQIGLAITGDDPKNIGGVTPALALLGQFGGWIAGLVWVSRRKGRGTLRADFGFVVRIRDAGILLVGIAFEERAFTVEEAYTAREAFVTSASQIVQPVVSIDGRPVGNGAPGLVASALRRDYHRFAEIS